jgi:cysteine desulfuration protein SufE
MNQDRELSVEWQGNELINSFFIHSLTSEQKYQKIMEIGARLPPYPVENKTEENIVPGCQSIVFIHAEEIDGKLYFNAQSDSLLSAGLAYLCITFYSNLSPEEILKKPPEFLDTLGLTKSLTPGRSNGLASMINTIKKISLHFIIKNK